MPKGRQHGNREVKKPKTTKKPGVSNTRQAALQDQIHVRTPLPKGEKKKTRMPELLSVHSPASRPAPTPRAARYNKQYRQIDMADSDIQFGADTCEAAITAKDITDIIDPTKVVRIVLQDVASTVGLLITTGALMSELSYEARYADRRGHVS